MAELSITINLNRENKSIFFGKNTKIVRSSVRPVEMPAEPNRLIPIANMDAEAPAKSPIILVT